MVDIVYYISVCYKLFATRGILMSRPAPRLLRVIRAYSVTPHMRRIVLGGEGLTGFPDGHESANFKLLLPPADGGPLNLDDLRATVRATRPIVRTYTVRYYDAERQEVAVDFMMHRNHGPASGWAAQASPGDEVGFAGPGQPKFVNAEADWFFFAGDMSALPAIGANIERLPPAAKGHAVLEVLSEEDRQELTFPKGIKVTWVINPEPERSNSLLLDAVKRQPWLSGQPSVWAAGEGQTARALRHYFKRERQVEKHNLYTSGYWQIGMTEDVHQIAKRKE